MLALRGKPLPARRVGVPRTWKGFGHEKSSVSASDRCHHRYHCIGDTITSSGVAGRLGCRSRTWSNCWYGDRWNSGRRPRPWPRLLLLPRTERLLQSGCILRPLVLYGVSIRSVIARCDAEVRTTKVAERSAAFLCRRGSGWTPRKSCAGRDERDYYSAIAPYPSWYNYYRADPIKVPSSISDAAHTEMPDLAARFFADVAEPPATTSLRVDVPTLVLWGMQDPVCLPGLLDNLHDDAPNATVVRIEGRPLSNAVPFDVGKSCNPRLPAAYTSLKW
jgi:hypothetical protein